MDPIESHLLPLPISVKIDGVGAIRAPPSDNSESPLSSVSPSPLLPLSLDIKYLNEPSSIEYNKDKPNNATIAF